MLEIGSPSLLKKDAQFIPKFSPMENEFVLKTNGIKGLRSV